MARRLAVTTISSGGASASKDGGAEGKITLVGASAGGDAASCSTGSTATLLPAKVRAKNDAVTLKTRPSRWVWRLFDNQAAPEKPFNGQFL
jgi:hypothetical protein